MPFSETRDQSDHQTLSDKQMQSLIISGLVNGTTHSSIRQSCAPADRVIVLSVPVGPGLDAQKVPCLCLKNNGLFDDIPVETKKVDNRK